MSTALATQCYIYCCCTEFGPKCLNGNFTRLYKCQISFILEIMIHVFLLGSKFPSKTLETSLEGTVYFSTSDEKIAKYDKFCTGLNSYILVNFSSVYFCSFCIILLVL